MIEWIQWFWNVEVTWTGHLSSRVSDRVISSQGISGSSQMGWFDRQYLADNRRHWRQLWQVSVYWFSFSLAYPKSWFWFYLTKFESTGLSDLVCVIMSSVSHQMQIKMMLGHNLQDLADGMVICCLFIILCICFKNWNNESHTWKPHFHMYTKFNYDF